MSRIDELIQELCPEGVRFSDLGSLCRIETGKRDANEANPTGKYLFFTTARETSLIDSYHWDCEALLVAGNANVGNVKHYRGKFDAYQRTYVLSNFLEGLDGRYLFFVLNNNLNYYLDSNKNVAAMTYIVLGTLKAFKVPVPPLKIQKEIVSILNRFTELESELEAELEVRKKQIETIREALLYGPQNSTKETKAKETFQNVIGHKSLGELGEFVRGSGLEKKDLEDKGSPVVHYGEVHTFYGFWADTTRSFVKPEVARKLKKAENGDVILVTTSENVEDVGKPLAWLGSEPVSVGGESYIFKSALDPLYLAQVFLSPTFKRACRKFISGTKVKRISERNLAKIEIPVPPLSRQKEIGLKLQALDSLINDVSSGIPAEIRARRIQYEYYRNKLLTFKELHAA